MQARKYCPNHNEFGTSSDPSIIYILSLAALIKSCEAGEIIAILDKRKKVTGEVKSFVSLLIPMKLSLVNRARKVGWSWSVAVKS